MHKSITFERQKQSFSTRVKLLDITLNTKLQATLYTKLQTTLDTKLQTTLDTKLCFVSQKVIRSSASILSNARKRQNFSTRAKVLDVRLTGKLTLILAI